jgi:hypothetical protein
VEAGDTFRYGHRHLYVVISDPGLDSEHVVIVNMSTDRGQDRACILQPGEHPFVRHQTCMRFCDARIQTNAEIEWLIASNVAQRGEPVSPGLLDRIRQGAGISAQTPFKCKQILAEQRLIEL